MTGSESTRDTFLVLLKKRYGVPLNPVAESEGLVRGVADDDSELVPHEVRESRGENVLEAESVGQTGLPDAIPDNEFDPDEVDDELALEDERNEGVTEGE